MKDDRTALALWQGSEGAADPFRPFVGLDGVGGRVQGRGGVLAQLRRRSPRPASRIMAEVYDDAVEPRGELRVGLVAPRTSVDVQKRLLCNVLCHVAPTQYAPGKAKHRMLMPAHQDAQRAHVAARHLGHERFIADGFWIHKTGPIPSPGPSYHAR